MEVGLEMRPIFVKKFLNSTKIGVGWRNKAGIPIFVIFVSVGVCGLDMEVVWKCALYLKENFLIILKLELGEGIRLESRNILFRSLMLSEVKI